MRIMGSAWIVKQASRFMILWLVSSAMIYYYFGYSVPNLFFMWLTEAFR